MLPYVLLARPSLRLRLPVPEVAAKNAVLQYSQTSQSVSRVTVSVSPHSVLLATTLEYTGTQYSQDLFFTFISPRPAPRNCFLFDVTML